MESVYVIHATAAGLEDPGRNLPKEPEFDREPSNKNSEHVFSGTTLDQEHHRLQEGAGEVDESKVALLDTACTSCLHSRRWREAYMKNLPPEFVSQCAPTATRKTFHFANGASTPDKLVVWRIPIFVKNVPGEVFSAEVESGSTPLLLSIPAMKALAMVLDMQAETVFVGALKVNVEMLTTRTKHLAIRVALEDGATWTSSPKAELQPRAVSEAEDILVYYLYEAKLPLLHQLPPPQAFAAGEVNRDRPAPDLSARGVTARDRKGTLTSRRAAELRRAASKQAEQDNRSRRVLQRSFSLAEQWCTDGFQNTFLYEPFGGGRGVTQHAFEERGWTCSNPLVWKDGYDVFSRSTQAIAQQVLVEHRPYLLFVSGHSALWRVLADSRGASKEKAAKRVTGLLVSLCRRQQEAGRYFLLEVPPATCARAFDQVAKALLQRADGKLAFGDLCRFGQNGPDGRKPMRRRTGWLTNGEALLNALCLQCICPFGAHAVPTAKGADVEYPRPLCRAVCQGIVENMGLDYAAGMAGHGGLQPEARAYPVGEEEVDSADEDYEEPIEDDWRFGAEGQLIRVHRAPRRKLFLPLSSTAPPYPLSDLTGMRKTRMLLQDGTRREMEDDWNQASWNDRANTMDQPWIGETEFAVRRRAAPTAEAEPQQQEEPPDRRQGPEHDSAMPFDSAVYQDEDAVEEFSLDRYFDENGELREPLEQAPAAEEPQQEEEPPDRRALRRGRPRTRQLQRGFWTEVEDEQVTQMLEGTLDYVQQEGGPDWNKINLDTDLGKAWCDLEAGRADVQLILCSIRARRMKKPQPHAGAHEVPIRKSFIFLDSGKVLTTDWESWSTMSPASQVRPLIASGRRLYLVLYGNEAGEGPGQGGDDDPWRGREAARERQWQALPRELKQAIKRVHVNLGHADTKAMLRALRLAKASEVALKACRLFRCPACPRGAAHQARPSKLPMAEEFNVQVGLDVFAAKDASGQEWSWLNILCQGTTFQVTALLGETVANPSGAEVMEKLASHWLSWAGYPERGVATDRAKYFIAEVADDFAEHGCIFETAARAAPWQIGQVERHGGLWKAAFQRTVWAQQVQGREEVLWATAAVTQAKNSDSRRGGFSPAQWVLGKQIRLPAALCDEEEVSRLGAQALASTPGTKFFRKTQLRFAAREAFARASNSAALRRAELRQVRPARGPFPVGAYVFYYDSTQKEPSPNNWRGIARVIGREGSRTIWISHRGIILAVSPEHLARAFDQEVDQWSVVSQELELVSTAPVAGGTGFIDLRQAPLPEPATEGPQPLEDELAQELEEQAAQESASSRSISLRAESERDASRMRRSSEFFVSQEKRRKTARREVSTEAHAPPDQPVPAHQVPVNDPGNIDEELGGENLEEMEWDPDRHDYHQSGPRRQLTPVVEDPAAEAQEREAKRLKVASADFVADGPAETCSAYLAAETEHYLEERAEEHYRKYARAYAVLGVTRSDLVFGVRRNSFQEHYRALAAQGQPQDPVKKKARKEIRLHELSQEQQLLFTGPTGSDAREWDAWLSKGACDVLDEKDSARIRREKPDLVIPTRWVRTNKNDGIVGKDFLAKSRLVVQGFKDRSLGHFRRDAPTASAVAESLCLAICASFGFVLLAKDIKNAYFSGKNVGREVYLDQPRGGLPGLSKGQLLKANKAIYGFAEAARLFWLALKEHLEADGWQESRLEPALFYLRHKGELCGILVTHVDDIEGGVKAGMLTEAFQKSSLALEFATNHYRDFIFRGREVKQHQGSNHIDVAMKNYALSLKTVKVNPDRRAHLTSELEPEEKEAFQSHAGELGWLARQLRCDLAYENGVIQRCKADVCIADLLRLKQYVGQARRGADFRLRYWSDIDLRRAVIVHLADSGHANGTPDYKEEMKYKSVGGYFILAANPGILEGAEVRADVLAFHSTQTKRVCRSTLAAEASHLAEAVEAGDWIIVLLEEALSGKVDLKNWADVIEERPRAYVTDAKSVFDYLQRDATSTSSDKRMAIEGALLRETVRKRNAHIRWIDGQQNIANVLTKSNAEKDTLREFLRSGKTCLTQTDANKELKAKKQLERQNRRKVKNENQEHRQALSQARRAEAAREVEAYSGSDGGHSQRKEEGM